MKQQKAAWRLLESTLLVAGIVLAVWVWTALMRAEERIEKRLETSLHAQGVRCGVPAPGDIRAVDWSGADEVRLTAGFMAMRSPEGWAGRETTFLERDLVATDRRETIEVLSAASSVPWRGMRLGVCERADDGVETCGLEWTQEAATAGEAVKIVTQFMERPFCPDEVVWRADEGEIEIRGRIRLREGGA